MAKPKKKTTVEQTEIPMEGKGVASVRYPALDRLGNQFDLVREDRKNLKEKLDDLDLQIIEKMEELDVLVYRFDDRIMKLDPGKKHAKIRKLKPDEGFIATFKGESPIPIEK